MSASVYRDFPPYRLLDGDFAGVEREAKRKLEKLYHRSRDKAWDGREVLGNALERHGGVQLPEHKRDAVARIFGIILWGELAAWQISAELAHRLEDPEAKMAATGQAFDEARHFATMRDYLRSLGMEKLPPLEPFSREILREVLAEPSLEAKLIGMQLLVESVALTLFQLVAESGTEPVLTEILPFFERDEARHVGLGIIHLPELLSNVSMFKALKLQAFQVKVQTFVTWGSLNLRKDFQAIGVDPYEGMTRGLRFQREVFSKLDPEKRVRGLYRPGSLVNRVHDQAVEVFFPRYGKSIPTWYRRALGVLDGVAWAGAKAVDRLSPDSPGVEVVEAA